MEELGLGMSEKLKPCPFCGQKPYIEDCLNYITNKIESYYVVCNCQSVVDFDTKKRAIEAWNTRVIPKDYIKKSDVLRILDDYIACDFIGEIIEEISKLEG